MHPALNQQMQAARVLELTTERNRRHAGSAFDGPDAATPGPRRRRRFTLRRRVTVARPRTAVQ